MEHVACMCHENGYNILVRTP